MKGISKIDTLFERDEDFRIDTSRLTRPIVASIKYWVVTEKVDGTSMRIGWIDPELNEAELPPGAEPIIVHGNRSNFTALMGFVAGKTNSASLPPNLLKHCRDILISQADTAKSIMGAFQLASLTVYGEGYGEGIQKGGLYRKDQGFIAFDMKANNTYLTDDAVTQNCLRLGIPRVPILGLEGGNPFHVKTVQSFPWTLEEIVTTVQRGFFSFCSEQERPAEGIVARTIEPLYDNRGERLIVKLKTKDFTSGKGPR